MLTTDSVTVAVEVPVYLTPHDLRHFIEDLGFNIPLPPTTTLTGHIDFVQIRNGRVHILDYKPNAIRERPIAQLMIYALALSRRTGLRLFDFVCAWFDEHHYFEFYVRRESAMEECRDAYGCTGTHCARAHILVRGELA